MIKEVLSTLIYTDKPSLSTTLYVRKIACYYGLQKLQKNLAKMTSEFEIDCLFYALLSSICPVDKIIYINQTPVKEMMHL